LKRLLFLLLLFFFVYLTIFTWNLKTGLIDKIVGYTGLEVVGWILYPGDWVYSKTKKIWEDYIYLVNLKKENNLLKEQIKRLKLEVIKLKKEEKEAQRLRKLLRFSPPKGWTVQGARIISQSIGPNGVLKTLIIDKGSKDKIKVNTPVITQDGVVGRVVKVGYHFSVVLLLNDLNSRIPVISFHTRTKGIIKGTGNTFLKVLYIDQSAPLSQKEIFVTSGLANIFPKGLPVAKIVKIETHKGSLFKDVTALPLVNFKKLEEVLLLIPKR